MSNVKADARVVVERPKEIHCGECVKWCEKYFCKEVFHPTKAEDTCATVLHAKRRE